MLKTNAWVMFVIVAVMALCNCFAYGEEAAVQKDGAAAATAATAAVEVKQKTPDALFYAIAITMSMGSLAAGMAVGKVGSAAMGAAAEKPELLGKAIAFVGLGEGIALFGFLISLFLFSKI